MERRKVLIGIGSLAAGSAAAIGTGAFSEVQAERTVGVNVANDPNAYLRLVAASSYAKNTGTANTLELDFTGSNDEVDGNGVNWNAVTQFLHLFDIQNQGDETVGIQIGHLQTGTDFDPHLHWFVGRSGGETLCEYDRDEMANELNYDSPDDDDRVLEPGDVLPVGMYLITNDREGEVPSDWPDDGSVTINALSEANADHLAGV